MATQLAIFNRALRVLGKRGVASLTEPSETQRILSDLWPDCVQFCLEGGIWNFALRAAQLTGTAPVFFGYSHIFVKPADFVHLFVASVSKSLDPPLVNDFLDQAGFLYADSGTLWISYVSSDPANGGGNLAVWTQTFVSYVVHVLASWAALAITGDAELAERIEAAAGRYHLRALAIDSVAALPGLRPFNAEARGFPVEGHQALPIGMAPFFVPSVGGAVPGGNDGGRGR